MTREGPSLTVAAVAGIAEVRLPENPSTGFRWEPVSGVSELISVTYEAEPTSGPVAGGGGTRVFTIRIEDVSELVFELRRAWEPEALERRRVRIGG